MTQVWKITKKASLVFCILSLLLTVWLWKEMNPLFWYAVPMSFFFFVVAMGVRWIVTTLLWFGVFWMVKLTIGSSLAAFLVASVVSRLIRPLFRQTKRIQEQQDFGDIALLSAIQKRRASTRPE
ncbi:hypothetical protein ACFYKX_10225 [Cytobacillus sp. FJAT-54145]|uniref:Uncharacterized protein n=1 Tax=Cytobacillus spartinae TaxID=3299023 RepID=A0ABW6K9V0_9BACI